MSKGTATALAEDEDTRGPAATAGRPVLEVSGVVSGYGDLQVLRDVDLSVAEGTVEVVLGRNGAGKTTLLSAIAGIAPLWEGSVQFKGTEIGQRPAYRRARSRIQLVQEGKRVFRDLTVMQNVMLGTFTQRMSRSARATLAEEVLEQFPLLDGKREHRAAGLSGGQQQMLAIAQALAGQPELLMLDEPSAGLAPVVAAEVFQQVRILKERGLTVLLVEQLAELALDIADHVTVINRGEVVDAGVPEVFRDPKALHEAYFGRRTR